MPMTEQVRLDLEKEEVSPFHEQLLNHCRGLVDMSRSKMSSKYESWDRYDEAYRATRDMDKEDERTAAQKEPVKITVPITYSQVQTFISFCYAVLFQRENFFELVALEESAERSARVGETVLQRDLSYNNIYGKTYQFLLDAARFGLGVFKCGWVEEKQWVMEDVPAQTMDFLGVSLTTNEPRKVKRQTTKFQGNELRNISPYRFFPDVRLPICDFQKGEFCASEDEYAYVTLAEMESNGVISGLKHVEAFSSNRASDTRKQSRLSASLMTDIAGGGIKNASQSYSNVVITEVVIKLIPSKFLVEDKPLGPETYPVKYLVWIANDQRLVRVETFDYLHDEFPYQATEFSPDMHKFVNEGLSGSIDALQDIITWFLNSHIASVRQVIQNRLVVDPAGLEMDDIKQRKSVIRLKPNMSRQGIERWVHQLQVQDVTQNHMEDADAVHKLVQVVSGVNDNALGQFHTGRRSATEARNVSAGTASRLKTVASLIYYGAFKPLGEQMLSNLRQGLTLDVYVKIFGLAKDPTAADYFEFAKVTNQDLVGDYDFAIFDGTLPSEKFHTADALGELLQLALSSPEIAVYIGIDIKAVIFEIMRLRGIRHPERFTVPQLQQQLAMQQLATMRQNPSQNGNPQTNGNGSRSAANGSPAVA